MLQVNPEGSELEDEIFDPHEEACKSLLVRRRQNSPSLICYAATAQPRA